MPLMAYACSCKHVVKKYYRLVAQAPATVICELCGLDMKKQLSAPTSGSKITVDNGVQAKAVEIIPNIVELNEERSNKDYREE